MAIVTCPVCGYETVDPAPEWIDEDEIVEEVCEHCEAELYADSAAIP